MRLKESKFKIFLIAAFTATILSYLMLRGGFVMGGGESGVQFANLPAMKKSCSFAWADVILGLNYSSVASSCPHYYLLGSLAESGVSGYILQIGFHTLYIFLGLLGCILLFKELKPNTSYWTTYLSGVFFLTNPFAIVNVWNRFLPNVVVFYCVLPILLFFAIKFINTMKLKYMFSFLVLSASSAYGFTGPAQTLLFWFLVAIFAVFVSKKKFYVTVVKIILLVFLWIAVNFWWIFAQLSFASSEYFLINTQDFFTSSGNIDTLVSISERLGKLHELILLRHSTFFENAKLLPFSWPNIFNMLPIKIGYISILITGIYICVKNRRRVEILALTLLIFGLFVTKGTNPPFGVVFGYFFSNISLLQFFRNPVEKLGIITTLGWSIIVLIVISYFFKKNSLLGKIITIGILVVQATPFVTGLIYTSPYPPGNTFSERNQVEIPKYYFELNNALNESVNDSRVLVIPQGNEGITYDWPKGYNGVEQSAILFSKPSLSYSTSVPYYYNISKKFEYQTLFMDNFNALAKAFGIQYVIYRPDVHATSSGIRDTEITLDHFRKNLSLNLNLSETGSYGPLKVYKLNDDISDRLFVSNNFIQTNKPDSIEIFSIFNLPPHAITIPINTEMNGSSKIIENRAVFINQKSNVNKSEDVRFFPHVQTNPLSKKYPLILVKEKINGINKLRSNDKAEYGLMLLGKRIKEIGLLDPETDQIIIKRFLGTYENKIDEVFSAILQVPHNSDEPIWHRQEVSEAILGHIFYLQEYKSKYVGLSGDFDRLIQKIQNIGIKYRIINSHIGNNLERLNNFITYQFETPSDGEYEIIIPKTRLFPREFLIPEKIDTYINREFLSIKPEVTDKGVSLGRVFLQKGVHEISLNKLKSKEYLNIHNLNLETGEMSSHVKFGPYVIDNKLKYDLSVATQPKVGQGIWLSILENNTPRSFDTNELLFPVNKFIGYDGYSFLPRQFETVYSPNPNSDYVTINFELPIWNNCKESYINNSKICLNENIYKTFNRKSETTILNASFSAFMPETAYLHQENSHPAEIINSVEYTHHTPVEYFARLNKNPETTIIAQLDTFDSGWKAKLNSVELDRSRHILVNGYANGWIINEGENGNFEIYFEPNNKLMVGYQLSGIMLFVLFLLTLLSVIKKLINEKLI